MHDTPISEILLKYDTDKERDHHYGKAYDDLFFQFDRKAPLHILEIGTQRGGSLCAWQDFFPKAKITGVDIVDVVKPEYRRDSINYVISDIKDWQTNEMFDIIIDDGSHLIEDVIYAINTFRGKLKKGGLMIVEDIQDIDLWKDKFEIIDLRGNYDSVLLILRND